MHYITWAAMIVASSLVWSKDILERDQVMGGEKGSSISSWTSSSYFLKDLFHSTVPAYNRSPFSPPYLTRLW